MRSRVNFNIVLMLPTIGISLAASGVTPSNLNIRDKGSLLDGLNQASSLLIRYYSPNEKGSVPENSSKDAKGVQVRSFGIC
jgi:hypothetical protein